MRLLLIEDNQELAFTMKQYLSSQYKYICDLALNGSEGELKAFDASYDVILLDLNLPDKNGFEILSFLRSEKIDTPILILTARMEQEAKIRGFELGGDDYITKPFDFAELHARIQAVVRRSYGRSHPRIIIGSLTIDPQTRTVTLNDQKLSLSVKEFDILEVIANNYPNIMSNEQIAEHVYDEDFDPFSSVLRVHMANLKKKLGYKQDSILKNIKGKGYYICTK